MKHLVLAAVAALAVVAAPVQAADAPMAPMTPEACKAAMDNCATQADAKKCMADLAAQNCKPDAKN